MRRERLFLLLSLAANVLLFTGLFYILNELARVRVVGVKESQQSDRLWRRVSELESAAKATAANKPPLTDTEVLELARLRSEVTRLRNEQRAASAKPAMGPVAPVGTPEQAAATKLISHSVTSSANLHLGHTIALGSWLSSNPGKQIIGFLTPELSGDGVMVATRIFEIPKSTLEQLGFDQFGNGATFTPDQFKGILQRAEQADGTDVLAMPRILTLSGREAEVAIRQRLADGTETGPLIRITPTVDATRTSVRLDFKFELNQLPSTSPAP